MSPLAAGYVLGGFSSVDTLKTDGLSANLKGIAVYNPG